MNLIVLAVLLSSADVEAHADTPHESRVGLQVGLGQLLAAPGYGPALTTGVRVRFTEHFVGMFDAGYGVLATGPTTQDRWWLMPSLALTFPVASLRVDLGAGVGLGASSGYANLPAFLKSPFGPDWAFQLVPAARVHASVAMPVSQHFTVFARLEAASLFLQGTSIGSRNGQQQNDSFANDTWVHFALGGEFGL
jgi:hypothetical protein